MKRLSVFLSLLFICTLVFPNIACTRIYQVREIAAFSDSPLSQCVFFGDSTTYGLFRFNIHNNGTFGKNYYTLQDSQVWVPKDGTFYLGNVLNASVCIGKNNYSLSDACQKYRPEVLIVTVGINGLASWTQENFSQCYKRLISTIQIASPNTKICLQSVYPLALEALERLPNFSNEKIDKINLWISELAKDHRLPYLNTASVLKNASGNLDERYHNGDGLHLSCEGFNAMLQYVEKQLMKGLI